MRKKLSELLNELYEAGTELDKYEATMDIIKALTSLGVSQEEAIEFVRVLVLLIYEHQCYKSLASDLERVLEDFQSMFGYFQHGKQHLEHVWNKLLRSVESDL